MLLFQCACKGIGELTFLQVEPGKEGKSAGVHLLAEFENWNEQQLVSVQCWRSVRMNMPVALKSATDLPLGSAKIFFS